MAVSRDAQQTVAYESCLGTERKGGQRDKGERRCLCGGEGTFPGSILSVLFITTPPSSSQHTFSYPPILPRTPRCLNGIALNARRRGRERTRVGEILQGCLIFRSCDHGSSSSSSSRSSSIPAYLKYPLKKKKKREAERDTERASISLDSLFGQSRVRRNPTPKHHIQRQRKIHVQR